MTARRLGSLHSARHEKAGIAPEAIDLPASHPAKEDIRPRQAFVTLEQVHTSVCQGQVLVHPVDQVFRALIQCIGSLQGFICVVAFEDNLQDLEDGRLDIALCRGNVF